MKLWRIAILFLFPLLSLAQSLPTIKAEVGEPVLQELMGGCSMACAFPWETSIVDAGKPPKPDYKLNDSDASTAWIDPNASVGTKLVFQFPKKLPKEMNGTMPFYGFDLADGYAKSDALFKSYGRLKKAKLFYNGKPLYFVTFADTRRWQHVNFDDIFVRQGDTFTLEVLEVYPGSKFPNLAVTQLVLQGAH